MTQEHTITPPPELVRQWLGNHFGTTVSGEVSDVELAIATQAARWGADTELEACCEWFLREGWNPEHPANLRAARRPKPPSLKEQALEILEINNDVDSQLNAAHYNILRLALQSLPD